MEAVLRALNNSALLFVLLLLSPYLFYTILALFIRQRKFKETNQLNRYAVLIAARNEESVIRQLIDSIHLQTYQGSIDIYVIADNCSDQTATVARSAGAHVIERTDKFKQGKGYALHDLISYVTHQVQSTYDAYVFFDADNLVHPDFFVEINKAYASGETLICSYRNSKNFASSWVSASSSIIFLREAHFLHQPRYALKTSTHISGTGYLVKADYFHQEGWDFYLLTEDIEFTINQILKGRSVAYCGSAIFYDEQPVKFGDSWFQRLRWIKGGLQCLTNYWKILTTQLFKKRRWAIFEILYWVSPLPYIAISLSLILSIAKFVYVLIMNPFSWAILVQALQYFIEWAIVVYVVSWVIAFLVIATEHRKIRASWFSQLASIFVFPFYVFTFLPIVYIALFSPNVYWKPIPHNDGASIDELM